MKQLNIKLILKSILFYITMFSYILFIMSVDDLSLKSLFLCILGLALLTYICHKVKFSNIELDIISGNSLFKKWGI
jgi:hypothetical protein